MVLKKVLFKSFSGSLLSGISPFSSALFTLSRDTAWIPPARVETKLEKKESTSAEASYAEAFSWRSSC
jgi:hypothetical protein